MKLRYCLGAGFVGVLAIGVVIVVGGQREPDPEPVDTASLAAPESVQVNLENRPLEKIPPGTVIGEKAPEGWTNLLILTSPVLSEEDQQKTGSSVQFYAQLFKWVLLGKVEKNGDAYDLKTVATGFAVNIKGKDTVIDSKHRMGANLGLLGGSVLDANEKGFAKDARQIVQTPTMRVIDIRGLMARDGKHVSMVLRYAILVDPKTGKVSMFHWLLADAEEGYELADNDMQLLPNGFREKYTLSVKLDRFNAFGIPQPDAFARRRLSQGKAVEFTPALRKVAAVKKFTEESALELEKELRKAA